MRAFVFTDDGYLLGKLKYELRGICECLLYTADAYTASDVLIADGKCPLPDEIIPDITLGDGIARQFELGALRELVLKMASGCRLRLEGDRSAVLDGVSVRLTELEYALLSALADARGGFVDRRTLCESVFGKADDDGMLNLYIHYLRDKLEVNGEKIILSQRGGGYRISEDFIGNGKRGEAK